MDDGLKEKLTERFAWGDEKEGCVARQKILPQMTLQLLELKIIQEKIKREKIPHITTRRKFKETIEECRLLIKSYKRHISKDPIELVSVYSKTYEDIKQMYQDYCKRDRTDLIVGLCAHATYLNERPSKRKGQTKLLPTPKERNHLKRLK